MGMERARLGVYGKRIASRRCNSALTDDLVPAQEPRPGPLFVLTCRVGKPVVSVCLQDAHRHGFFYRRDLQN